MNQLVLRIPGKPISQPRPRGAVVGGHARIYSPTDPVHRALIRQIAAEQYTGPLIEGPVRIDVRFVFRRTKQMIWSTKPMPRVPHTKTPDRDNLDKFVLDALSDVVLSDDAQVWDGRIVKWIAAGDEQPHTLIVIRWPWTAEAAEKT